MSTHPDLIPIGALSNLSGVPAETIRTWERRYELLSPQRDPRGRRVYGPEDVERLELVSRLADAGERVADLATMSNDQLRQRQRLHGGDPEPDLPEVIRAVVVHPTLGPMLPGEVADTGCRIDVIAASPDPRALEVEGPVDVLVLDLAALGPDPVDLVRVLAGRLAPTSTLVLYHYLSRPLRRSLQRCSSRLVQGPLSVEQIRRHAVDALLAEGSRPHEPSRTVERRTRFSRAALEQLLNRKADLQCECPNHLARLALALREFEIYSRGCASRGRPDAELHRDLANGTAEAYALMEDLLARVCDYDGIVV